MLYFEIMKDLEKELDILIDPLDKKVTITERVISDEPINVQERKQILDEHLRILKEHYGI